MDGGRSGFAPPPKATGRKRGAALLHGDSPQQILSALTDGDPLNLWGHCGSRLDHQALLFDQKRVAWRSAAYLSFKAAERQYRGDPPLNQFIESAIDEALRSLVEEDWEGDRSDAPIDHELEQYANLALEADLDPRHARRVTLEFNLQPLRLRRPLYAVLVENRAFAEVAETFGLATAELESHLRTMLVRMLPPGGTEADLDGALDALMGGGA